MKITTLEASGPQKLSALELHASLKPPLVSQSSLRALQSFCGASFTVYASFNSTPPSWEVARERKAIITRGEYIICPLLAQFIMNFSPPVDMAWEGKNEIIIYCLRFLICHRLSSVNSGFADRALGRNGISSGKRETSGLCSDSFSPLLCIWR